MGGHIGEAAVLGGVGADQGGSILQVLDLLAAVLGGVGADQGGNIIQTPAVV